MPFKVFIVEDNPDFADTLSDLLAVNGVAQTVGRAASEADALAWSFHNEHAFDVAIVDLILKQGSGFAVVAHLVKYQPGQVIVLSDFVSPSIRDRCLKLGAAAAFSKAKVQQCVDFIRGLPQPGKTVD